MWPTTQTKVVAVRSYAAAISPHGAGVLDAMAGLACCPIARRWRRAVAPFYGLAADVSLPVAVMVRCRERPLLTWRCCLRMSFQSSSPLLRWSVGAWHCVGIARSRSTVHAHRMHQTCPAVRKETLYHASTRDRAGGRQKTSRRSPHPARFPRAHGDLEGFLTEVRVSLVLLMISFSIKAAVAGLPTQKPSAPGWRRRRGAVRTCTTENLSDGGSRPARDGVEFVRVG